MTVTLQPRTSWIVALAVGLAALVSPAQARSQAPTQSFVELQRTLPTGQRVVLVDGQNRRGTGEVVSIGRNQIELYSTRLRRTVTFAERDVRWIGEDDSTWNGQLIGFGSGLLAAIGIIAGAESDRAQFAALIFAVPMGGVIGRTIDQGHRRTLYGSSKTAFVVTPSFGARAVGIKATVAF